MASSRPRRNASIRVGHLEPADGAEQYTLDQVCNYYSYLHCLMLTKKYDLYKIYMVMVHTPTYRIYGTYRRYDTGILQAIG